MSEPTDEMCLKLIESFAKDAENSPPGTCPTPQEQLERARRALRAALGESLNPGGGLHPMKGLAIPYPAVFRDWQYPPRRVATSRCGMGVSVEMFDPKSGLWRVVTLTEDDASLLAAALLRKAGHKKLSKRVLRRLRKQARKEP